MHPPMWYKQLDAAVHSRVSAGVLMNHVGLGLVLEATTM